jgi:1,2-diacylglycerol 3-beta-galactosyltransferase
MKPAQGVPRQQQSPHVDFIYFDAGGGHRASATALKEVIEQQQRPWQVRLLNLREVLEPIDFIRRLTGIRVEDLYNGILKHSLTISIGPMLTVMHILIERMYPQMVELLARYWRDSRSDLVVSLIPHFNRAIFAGLREATEITTGSLPWPRF